MGLREQEVDLGPVSPNLLALSTQAVRVGEPITFRCNGCIGRDKGRVELDLNGTYENDAGGSEPATFKVSLSADQQGDVLWPAFGGYRIPFGACAEGGACSTGTFNGTVCAINRYNDGTVGQPDAAQCLNTSIEVLPSIVVRDFFAFSDEGQWRSSCKYPAQTALVGASYQLEVEAVGFSPTSFDYVVSGGAAVEGNRARARDQSFSYRRQDLTASPPQAALIVAPSPVPLGFTGYNMSISVTGLGDPQERQGVTLNYRYMVRQPLTTFLRPRGWQRTVEIYPREVKAGCNSGNISNNNNLFVDTKAISRTQTVSQRIAQNLGRSQVDTHNETYAGQETESVSEESGSTVTVTDTRSANQTISSNRSVSDARSFSRADNRVNGLTEYDLTTTTQTLTEATDQYRTREGLNYNEVGSKEGGEVGFAGIGGVIGGAAKDITGTTGTTGTVAGTVLGSTNDNFANQRGETTQTSFSGTDTDGQSQTNTLGSSVGSEWGLANTLSNANSETASTTLGRTSTFSTALAQSLGLAEQSAEALTETLSVTETEISTIGVDQEIFAGNIGVLYHQAYRRLTLFDVVAFDLCGNGTVVGESIITKWHVGREIAQDDRCFPRDCLMPPQCVVEEYCDNEYPAITSDPPNRHPYCGNKSLIFREPSDPVVQGGAVFEAGQLQ